MNINQYVWELCSESQLFNVYQKNSASSHLVSPYSSPPLHPPHTSPPPCHECLQATFHIHSQTWCWLQYWHLAFPSSQALTQSPTVIPAAICSEILRFLLLWVPQPQSKAVSSGYLWKVLWVNTALLKQGDFLFGNIVPGSFPDSSVGKESSCNGRRPGVGSWVGKFPWRRDRLPTSVFFAFLVAQLVKNPPAVLETCVQSLSWEDLLGKGKAAHSSILAWRITSCIVHGVTKSQTRSSHFHFQYCTYSELIMLPRA